MLFFPSVLIFTSEGFAQGNLIIIPRRVVFEGPKRTEALSLANTGADTAKYLISVIHYRMLDNGAFELITQPDSGQYFADKNFRFFPRSVVLAPNEAQTVKLQTINTSGLNPGEYRSHLYFRSVPNVKPPGEQPADTNSKEISVKLVPIFGIAIPVIIRVGPPVSTVAVERAALEIDGQGARQLKTTFSRTGNVSVYGDIQIDHVSPQGKTTRVSLVKGFAIYTPNKQRHAVFPLVDHQNFSYHTGKLRILFTTTSGTRTVKIAETELELH
ncbi:hypothetical protein [Pedobacter sp. PLR]|uniref:hypothetical protein n=1 Tax=Pedobacter sp. PLR TaxID=2994465 RepID=UPI0022472D4F|nr:hypothetical protein [Pedobacter sp. PLR]